MLRRRDHRHEPSRTAVIAASAAAVAIVVAGVAAQLYRPLAPDLGAVPDPGQWFGSALLDRIAAYRVPLRGVGVAAQLAEVLVPLAVATTRPGRAAVDRIVSGVGDARPVRAAVAVVAAVVVVTAVVQLPLGLWAHRHARAFGLSTQSTPGWFGDWAIARGIELATVVALTAAGYALLRRSPARWAFVAAPAGIVVVAATVLAAPLVVEPLRFDLQPLPEGSLRQELETVLAADGRTRAPLLVADASRRTTTQNAYVSGLWGTRRVVLYDTLLERPPAEVAQVLAHELAHQRHGDLPRAVLGGAAAWVAGVGAVAVMLRRRVRSGRQRDAADPRGAAAVVALVAALLLVSTPVTAWASRRAEAAADLGALELTGDPGTFCRMQRGLVQRNLSDPAPPEWQRRWSWSHPPAASRIELARRWSGDASGECAPTGRPAPARTG